MLGQPFIIQIQKLSFFIIRQYTFDVIMFDYNISSLSLHQISVISM